MVLKLHNARPEPATRPIQIYRRGADALRKLWGGNDHIHPQAALAGTGFRASDLGIRNVDPQLKARQLCLAMSTEPGATGGAQTPEPSEPVALYKPTKETIDHIGITIANYRQKFPDKFIGKAVKITKRTLAAVGSLTLFSLTSHLGALISFALPFTAPAPLTLLVGLILPGVAIYGTYRLFRQSARARQEMDKLYIETKYEEALAWLVVETPQDKYILEYFSESQKKDINNIVGAIKFCQAAREALAEAATGKKLDTRKYNQTEVGTLIKKLKADRNELEVIEDLRQISNELLEHTLANPDTGRAELEAKLRQYADRVTSIEEKLKTRTIDITDGDGNKYTLTKKIKEGGMGSIFVATRQSDGKQVAIKFLAEELEGEMEALSRFAREHASLKALDHPNAPRVFGFGQYERSLFIVFEYIEGTDLSGQAPISAEKTVKYAASVANVLAELIKLGIVHRDVKAANIVVETATDEAHLVDFGLAKSASGKDDVTIAGTLLGTMSHLDPIIRSTLEQKDRYSLGVVMFFLATGTLPFEVKDLATYMQLTIKAEQGDISSADFTSNNITTPLQEVIYRLTDPDLSQRYTNYAQLTADLASVAKGEMPGPLLKAADIPTAVAKAPAAPQTAEPTAVLAPEVQAAHQANVQAPVQLDELGEARKTVEDIIYGNVEITKPNKRATIAALNNIGTKYPELENDVDSAIDIVNRVK